MADDKADSAQSADDVKEEKVTPAEPSTEKKEEPKVDPVTEALKDDEENPKDEPKAEPKAEEKEEPKEESKEEPETTEVEEQPKSKAEERKEKLNTEIRDLVSKRNKIKAEVEKANAEIYQPATEEDLTEEVNPETGQNFTGIEAKVEAMRQQQAMDKYNAEVADQQLTLSSESERVLNDFPIFDPESDSYDKELATEAAELLQSNLIYDENTKQIIGSNVSPYQLYKTIAKATGISAVKGQIKGQEATEQMLANADAGTSTGPQKTAKDPVLSILASDDD